ncbi:MAG: hypothetical protein AABZ15_09265 [Nitrospirota bacterium]|mgnify:CR=1 FL=1
MKQDNADIFVPRVSPKPGLLPAPEKLNAFLDGMKKEGYLVTLVNGIGKVREMLIDIDVFEQRRKLEPGLQDLRERMVFGVLRHSRFINEELLTAAAQFQYQLKALIECDFESPAEFIASAEKTMKKLKRHKIDDMVRMGRLTEMVEERRNILVGLDARWAALTGELRDIVDFVRVNLLRIETLCHKSIVVLVEIGLEKKKENDLIEEIREQFLQELKSATGVRQLTDGDLEKAKEICDRLAKKLSEMIRDDQYSLSWIYEVVHDRAKGIVAELDGLLDDLARMKAEERRESLLLYQKIGQVLISLIVDFPAGLRPGKIDLGATRNAHLMEKRRDMIDHLLDQAGLERRERSDRRARQERRKAKDPNYSGPERRINTERRTRAGRRVG